LRWSRFKSFEAREMFKVVDEHVFPFLRTLGGEGSAFSEHMKDARSARSSAARETSASPGNAALQGALPLNGNGARTATT